MNVNQQQNQNKTADGQSRAGEAGANLTDVLSTHEKALIERAMAIYSRTNMSGSRDFYEEELFNSVKHKLGLVGG